MDIADTIACFRYYAGLADKSHGQSNNHFGTDKLVYTLNQPIGVCGQMYAISSLIVASADNQYPMELPSPDVGLESRPSPRCRMYDRHEAFRADPFDRYGPL
jgi:hypothetical protein